MCNIDLSQKQISVKLTFLLPAAITKHRAQATTLTTHFFTDLLVVIVVRLLESEPFFGRSAEAMVIGGLRACQATMVQ
jgi:hypothetical protein